jgi:hypothetical protein
MSEMKIRKTSLFLLLAVIAITVITGLFIGNSIARSTGDSRERAEYEHGIKLPASAVAIQCRGDGWLRKSPFHGGGATAMFEMDPADTAAFLAPLHVRSRTAPALATGDPTVNGWNVWPQGAPTFIPGNRQFGGFHRSWSGEAVPVEMVSCDSPEGGWWLHLEFWKLESGMTLVKMGTQWPD